MNGTGIIRRIDDLGRIVIPKEVRRAMRVAEGDPLEIILTDEGIFLRRYDETRPIMQVVQELHTLITDSNGFNHKKDVLEKLNEIAVLVKDEQREGGQI